MPMHDWTRVEAGIYHDFHLGWISELGRHLNRGLPRGFYALIERQKAHDDFDSEPRAESDLDFYLRKRRSLSVRRERDDRIVARIEMVSAANKDHRHGIERFLALAAELLDNRIHLLVIDPFPPGPRDPNGIHESIWKTVEGAPFELPPDKPLTLASYQCSEVTCSYVETIAVGDAVPEMPLFVEPHDYVNVPLEATYQAAWEMVPERWRRVVANG
jgi:hypothetical protein